MLKYLVTVTEDLMIAVPLLSLLSALCTLSYGPSGRWIRRLGIALAIALSAAMAIVKNSTGLIATNQWNQCIFYLTILLSVLFIVLSPFLFHSSRQNGQVPRARALAGSILAALLAMLLIFYEMPDVMAYPARFETVGEGVLSVAFLVRFLGWTGALILCGVFMRFLLRCGITLGSERLLLTILNLSLTANAVRCFGQILRPWITGPRWFRHTHAFLFPAYSPKAYPWAFPVAAFIHNSTLLFILVVVLLSLLPPLVLFCRSLKVRGLWNNPAQHRRLRANNRRNRRWAVTVVICTVIAAFNLTAVKSYDNREIELTPPEPYTISEGNQVLIPLEQINDGHLHRFEYRTENGIDVRWIAVKKPGSAAYGVGLDACEVCGSAGYYERGGTQVVCKRCDVVMNINTIGFKGGCNPIPLESTVSGGYLIIPLEKIIAGEKEFR